MLNSKPTFETDKKGNPKYNQGLYIPKNIDKVILLNNQGGLYYRSGLELKMMVYLDNYEGIIKWGAEFISVPYIKQMRVDGKLKTTKHIYYPDFYYELKDKAGKIIKVLAEVKPSSQTVKPTLPEGKSVDELTIKQKRNLQYDINMYVTNIAKWKQVVEFCKLNNLVFKIITEKDLK